MEGFSSTTGLRDNANRRWGAVRTHVLTLNAARRFRTAKRFRGATTVITAANKFVNGALQDRKRRTKEDPGLREDWQKARATQNRSRYGMSKEELNFLAQYHYLEGLRSVDGVAGLVSRLHSDAVDGIHPDEVEERMGVFDSNRYSKKRMKSFSRFFFEAFQDPTLVILTVCAVVSVVVGIIAKGKETGWYDGVAISFAIIAVVLVTSISDYKQACQFRGISEVKENVLVTVSRGGSREVISIWELVVGDVVHLRSGDQIPGDGVLMQGHNFLVDESSMTGESVYVKKDKNERPFLMSGCKVADGQGKMLVIAVGINTEWGRIMATLSGDTSEQTPLQVRLYGAATFIGTIGLAVAVLVLIVLLIRFGVNAHKIPKTAEKIKEVIDIIEVAVAIVVVSVPEGLPLAVTLTLAYSMRQMMTDKAFVRKLAACETMGSATTICSDKTGTLTKNEMEVVRAWVAGKLRDENEVQNLKSSCSEFYSILLEGIVHNVEGDVSKDHQGIDKVHASPTEAAILKWGLMIGMRFREMKQSILKVEPFNSTRKCSGVVMKLTDQSGVRVHWKGASEMILQMCEDCYDVESNRLEPLTNAKREELLRTIEDMAKGGLRTLVLAYCDVHNGYPSDEQQAESWTVPSDNLICLAILGIKDPCRLGVQGAVATCQKAGVKVRMVTGDNLITAKTIAMECGILDDGEAIEKIIEGASFRRLSPLEKRRAARNIVVMARSSPTDKLDLVRALRENGDVVAVTGDGTNDAPALHEADIGLAMGIAGTEVAKDSADIVILDDNFASIVKVVRWGRSVYANIQKFIQFQLTVNVVALTLNFIAALGGTEIPLTTVQLLWVNLIMDAFGALALATEPPHDKLLQRRPVGRTEPLITNKMWHNILGQAVYQIFVLLLLQYTGEDVFDEPKDVIRSMIFNAFVFCQLFNEINSRKPDEINVIEGMHKNNIFIGVLLTTGFIQALIINFAEDFANTKRLGYDLWLVCIVIGLCGMPVAAVVKLIPTREEPYFRNNLLSQIWKKNGSPSSDPQPEAGATTKL